MQDEEELGGSGGDGEGRQPEEKVLFHRKAQMLAEDLCARFGKSQK